MSIFFGHLYGLIAGLTKRDNNTRRAAVALPGGSVRADAATVARLVAFRKARPRPWRTWPGGRK